MTLPDKEKLEDWFSRYDTGHMCNVPYEQDKSGMYEVIKAAQFLLEHHDALTELVGLRKNCKPYGYHTKKDLDEAMHQVLEEGEFSCPMCDGEGNVEGVQHINLKGDVIAMNVLFSGIGNDFIKWQKFHDAAANFFNRLKGEK